MFKYTIFGSSIFLYSGHRLPLSTSHVPAAAERVVVRREPTGPLGVTELLYSLNHLSQEKS